MKRTVKRTTIESDDHDAIWAYVDKAWAKADEAFQAASDAFEETFKTAESKLHEARQSNVVEHDNRLEFRCPDLAERWRLFKRFTGMGFSALFRGKAFLHFKTRPKQ